MEIVSNFHADAALTLRKKRGFSVCSVAGSRSCDYQSDPHFPCGIALNAVEQGALAFFEIFLTDEALLQKLLEQAQAGTLTPPTPEGEEEETPSEGDPSGTQTGESGSAPDNETGTESPAEDPADSDTAGDDPSEQGPADSGTAVPESDSQTS